MIAGVLQMLTELEADRRAKVYSELNVHFTFDVENSDTAQYVIDTAIVGNAGRLREHPLLLSNLD